MYLYFVNANLRYKLWYGEDNYMEWRWLPYIFFISRYYSIILYFTVVAVFYLF